MLHALCFSMNRPMQLDGYLRSVRRFIHPMPALSVLFRATTPFFREGYDEIERKHPDVKFILERNFAGQLGNWLNQTGPLVMFGCDDVIFVRNVDLESATALLSGEKELLACSLRLGCNIRFSQSEPLEIPQPAFQRIGEMLVWNWQQEKAHWRYPFELNGTIYRHDFLVRLFNDLENRRRRQPAAEWRHPNLLELRGNELLMNAGSSALMFCLMESALIVPTVNRVQDYFDNPLLGAAQDLQALETRRREGWELDLDAFNAEHYDRIHVGSFHLRHPQANATPSHKVKWLREARVKNPALSIIMAAWQAGKYMGEAIQSILQQTGIAFELIVVDDASTDGTLDTALSFEDPRLAVGRMEERLFAGAVRNLAIKKAGAPWICIFDSDDVMEPNSLSSYFAAVAAQKTVNWAYCGLSLIDAEGHELGSQMRTPFELLRMLQRNVVSHPMSLYTRKLFDLAGGYDETLKHSQDYELWLRFLFSLNRSFTTGYACAIGGMATA